jgi:hypothetical protein
MLLLVIGEKMGGGGRVFLGGKEPYQEVKKI